MDNLVISMEATSDITKELAEKYNLCIAPMSFLIDGEEFSTTKHDVVSSGLYEKMREWKKTSTSQINEENYYEFFSELLKNGNEILHIGFSSGLSGSVNSAKLAADRLNNEQGSKIIVIDSLSGCYGQVILGVLAREFSKNATTIEDVVEYVEELKPKIIHRFSVDNLKYLANGGRISGVSAIVGNLLSIKPIIRVDDNGKLVSMMKVISRKKALRTLVNQFKQEVNKNFKFCFISHSDCEVDAVYMKELIEAETDYLPVIDNIGPVLGCHCGPGTVAMFYVGDKR